MRHCSQRTGTVHQVRISCFSPLLLFIHFFVFVEIHQKLRTRGEKTHAKKKKEAKQTTKKKVKPLKKKKEKKRRDKKKEMKKKKMKSEKKKTNVLKRSQSINLVYDRSADRNGCFQEQAPRLSLSPSSEKTRNVLIYAQIHQFPHQTRKCQKAFLICLMHFGYKGHRSKNMKKSNRHLVGPPVSKPKHNCRSHF